MIALTLDTETTGLLPEDKVIEIGLVTRDLNDPRAIVWEWSTLVKPKVPVHPAARAAHHITNAELAAAPTIVKVRRQLHMRLIKADVLVGHNLEFDERMLLQSGIPQSMLPPYRLCTWRCARHLWPDAPGYGNQTLRYHFELDVQPNGPPHRALPDAIVTDALLRHMLKECSIERLIELTSTPVLQTKVGFGKYRGKLWSEVDLSYLQWLNNPQREPPFNEEIKYAVAHWIQQRRAKK
jgi:exodeoxyribonuclease X